MDNDTEHPNPFLCLTDGDPITLEQMLLARDERVRYQNNLLAQYGKPLISLTMVIPGAIKASSGSSFLFEEALLAFSHLCRTSKWAVLDKKITHAPTGSEALLVIDHVQAPTIKQATAHLEDTHPLGRLWDFDVICAQNGALSRRATGAPPRTCLICQEAAHACARARKHTQADLQAVILEKLNSYYRTL